MLFKDDLYYFYSKLDLFAYFLSVVYLFCYYLLYMNFIDLYFLFITIVVIYSSFPRPILSSQVGQLTDRKGRKVFFCKLF